MLDTSTVTIPCGVIFKTLLNPEDEVIVFAPFFGEYRNYVNNFSGKLIVVSPDVAHFQLNLEEFESKITKKTKAVIINNPNNPTGTVYSEETIQKLINKDSALMNKLKNKVDYTSRNYLKNEVKKYERKD